jgi:hypothetical protein
MNEKEQGNEGGRKGRGEGGVRQRERKSKRERFMRVCNPRE